jgi:hypothetical protein
MRKSKKESFAFYPIDWMSDSRLRLCSAGARGLWIDILCLMHLSNERGYLLIEDTILDEEMLQKTLGYDAKEFDNCFMELRRYNIIKKDEKNRYFSKTMVNAQKISEKRSVSGRLGGNPNLKLLDKQNEILVDNLVKQNSNLLKQNPNLDKQNEILDKQNVNLVKQNQILVKQNEKNDPIYIYNNINIDNIDNIGYNNNIPLSNDKERKDEKKERKSEIVISHPLQVYIKDNFPQVSKLKKQISSDECEKLLCKFTNQQIAEVLMRMENFKQLPSKYVSVYLTLNNWLNRQPNESPSNKHNNRGANYEDALRNF